jgi:hypothetical protein
MLLNPFCPFSAARILALKATVALLLTLLFKAKLKIVGFSALGMVLLLAQLLVVLAAAGAFSLVLGAAGVDAYKQRRAASV